MSKKVLRKVNFIVLILMLFVGILLFSSFRTDKIAQIYIGMLISALYVAWGVLYHFLEDGLHIQVVIEYLLVGLIAMALIVTLVWI